MNKTFYDAFISYSQRDSKGFGVQLNTQLTVNEITQRTNEKCSFTLPYFR